VYDDRRNPNEAAYIAQLVRSLLGRDTELSIGVVAFSEAQQAEIEDALGRAASEDSVFAAQLEAEYVREENDVFCGLIVKNLENIQGDERDIIIMSVCYGHDAGGRMLMNFGPINQRGGEKRLNVIFSRARHHMAIVSSIRHHDITNDYNDGANSLKNFLQYAEAISKGDGS
jgi:superfamily I DNA and/or RNA helicase